MDKPTFVYVIYIASAPEKVFEALTSADMTEQFWFGYRLRSDWNAGSPYWAKSPGGSDFEKGVVLESDPPRRLSYTWHPQYADVAHERPSRVTFELVQVKNQVQLTIVHDDFDQGSKVFESISKGWPAVLSSLKTFLETGRGLAFPLNDEDRKRHAAAAADA